MLLKYMYHKKHNIVPAFLKGLAYFQRNSVAISKEKEIQESFTNEVLTNQFV